MKWSAEQYVAFEDERTRPVRDLLNAVQDIDARLVVDLGCGPGNSTEVLAARFPGAVVKGVDNSAEMIEAARRRLPKLSFEKAAIESWAEPGPFDAILANAVFQWVPDHSTVLPGLMARLAKGGSLAIQMPDNLEEPAHRLMRKVATEGPWAEKLSSAAAARTSLGGADWYYEMLRPHSARVDVWRTIYHHPLAGGLDGIVEWFKGSGLRPFLAPLDANEQAAYLARYREQLAEEYRTLPDGTVLLPFPRLFIVATR
jgi:trans-aconitate 2-methyltransferase